MAQLAHTFRIEEKVLNALKKIAASDKRSLNTLVEIVLEDYVSKNNKK